LSRKSSVAAALEKKLTEIDTGVRGSPVWRDKEDLLASVPGVGSLTGKQIASLAGLAPIPASPASGRAKA
jgi:transposase